MRTVTFYDLPVIKKQQQNNTLYKLNYVDKSLLMLIMILFIQTVYDFIEVKWILGFWGQWRFFLPKHYIIWYCERYLEFENQNIKVVFFLMVWLLPSISWVWNHETIDSLVKKNDITFRNVMLKLVFFFIQRYDIKMTGGHNSNTQFLEYILKSTYSLLLLCWMNFNSVNLYYIIILY